MVSGSELSEPPSEDDWPHNNNKPTTKKPRTGRGIVPAPMWEWSKKKPSKPVDDDGCDIANVDKTTNDDDDVDEKLVDVDDDDDVDDREAAPNLVQTQKAISPLRLPTHPTQII